MLRNLYQSASSVNETQAVESECPSVLDRVKRAILFGASAVIILALNPKLLQELDVAQLLAQPIIIITDKDNITAMLNILRSKLRLRAKLTCGSFPSDYHVQTVITWSACWRARPGSDVVCMADADTSRLSKVIDE